MNPLFTQFSNQIGGHKGLLIDENGKILKPLQLPPRGPRELEFYTNIFNRKIKKDEAGQMQTESDELINDALKKIIPKFYGVVTHENKQDYIILEDITYGFKKPCTMDIKIGQQIWDSSTPPEKVAKRKLKYKTLEPLGLCLIGCIYYNDQGQKVKIEKDYGKSIGVSEFIQTMKLFFHSQPNPTRRTRVISEILSLLRNIRQLFQTQTLYEFNSSSILISFEGEQGQEDDDAANAAGLGRVFLIDFAHYFKQNDTRRIDNNFLYGLNHLISIIQSIQDNKTD